MGKFCWWFTVGYTSDTGLESRKNVFFYVRITNADSESQQTSTVKSIMQKHEAEIKSAGHIRLWAEILIICTTKHSPNKCMVPRYEIQVWFLQEQNLDFISWKHAFVWTMFSSVHNERVIQAILLTISCCMKQLWFRAWKLQLLGDSSKIVASCTWLLMFQWKKKSMYLQIYQSKYNE